MSWFRKKKEIEEDLKPSKEKNLEYYGEIFIFFLKYKYNFTIEEMSKILLVNTTFIEEVINDRKIEFCKRPEETSFFIREALRIKKELKEWIELRESEEFRKKEKIKKLEKEIEDNKKQINKLKNK